MADANSISVLDHSALPTVLGGNVFGWTADRDASFAVLDAYVAAGGTLIDTADGYSAWVPGNKGGESETLLGEWTAARGNRDQVHIATKVSTHPDFPGLSPKNIAAAVRASLGRLQADVIDLYYAHFDDADTPLAETAAAFSALVDEGLIRHIGLSNYTPERIDEWFAIAERDGLHKPVALQPHYNLVERGYETGLRERAERHGLEVFPYYSLASGFLTGKYRSDGDAPASPRAQGAAKYLNERGNRVLGVLDEVSARTGASVTSVSLAWLRQQPTVTAPIASARTVEQLADLVASASLVLSDEDLAALEVASR